MGSSFLLVQNHKRVVFVVLILLLCVFSLSATKAGWEEVKWSWHCQAEGVNWFRYQLNAEDEANWTVVDSSVTSVFLLTDNRIGDVTTLYVQSSYDGLVWSESGSTTYVGHRYIPDYSIKVVVAPYSLALYRFYNGYNTTSTRTKTNSVYGFAGSVEFGIAPLKWLRPYLEAGYKLAIKQETIIPGQKNVHYVKGGIGVDFTFDVLQKSTLYAGLFGGAMAHINNNKANITPYFGARFGYDYAISDSFLIGALSRVSFALFIENSGSLMNSLTVLLEPVAITLTYKF